MKNYTFVSGKVTNGHDVHEKSKGQPRKTGTKRVIKEEHDEANNQTKKQKNSQKTNFKSLNVPVDEEFLTEHRRIPGFGFSSQYHTLDLCHSHN